ncbi:uncharacterized protein RAG0_14073 [Rhynchosporium agropyri]|uniref:Enoyl reductase (ER) domain-containing protein n=1 Tax=Rhynchosporium agropyri TaxID=914238 RepID=A0A1E1LFH2_9HELO|nr:uncharacterized protein RAG0_14073 [Rhynchosporium agropyri]
MRSRTGLWVSQGGQLEIRQLPPISASMLQPDEYLIRVLYSGLNPADQKHSMFLGLCDLVAGYDFAGTPGTLVCGLSRTGVCVGNKESGLHGAHQQYLVAPSKDLFELPAQTSDAELQVLATLPVIAATAADCLFGLLGLDPNPDPSVSSAKNNIPLLVWGGGSAVGHATIQFAREVGVVPIIVFASPTHHAQLQHLGAARCFDYHEPIDVLRAQVALALSQLCPDRRLRFAIDASGISYDEIQAILNDTVTHSNTGFNASVDRGDDGISRIVSTVRGPRGTNKPFAAVILGEDVHLSIIGGGNLVVPARPAHEKIVADKVRWAIQHIGKGFHQVPVEIINGSWPALIDAVKQVAAGVSFRKMVFKIPHDFDAEASVL